MTTCLGKSCLFGLPCVSLVNVGVRVLFSPGFEGCMWDLIVLVPDRCI